MSKKGFAESIPTIGWIIIGLIVIVGAAAVLGVFEPLTNILSLKVKCVNCLFAHDYNACVESALCLRSG